jgi:hypothetical protein
MNSAQIVTPERLEKILGIQKLLKDLDFKPMVVQCIQNRNYRLLEYFYKNAFMSNVQAEVKYMYMPLVLKYCKICFDYSTETNFQKYLTEKFDDKKFYVYSSVQILQDPRSDENYMACISVDDLNSMYEPVNNDFTKIASSDQLDAFMIFNYLDEPTIAAMVTYFAEKHNFELMERFMNSYERVSISPKFSRKEMLKICDHILKQMYREDVAHFFVNELIRDSKCKNFKGIYVISKVNYGFASKDSDLFVPLLESEVYVRSCECECEYDYLVIFSFEELFDSKEFKDAVDALHFFMYRPFELVHKYKYFMDALTSTAMDMFNRTGSSTFVAEFDSDAKVLIHNDLQEKLQDKLQDKLQEKKVKVVDIYHLDVSLIRPTIKIEYHIKRTQLDGIAFYFKNPF